MKTDVLLGLQWGDEGKGKIVDVLTSKYDIIARFQGGPNAGHTLEFNNIKHVLHTIPSGIFHKNVINLIGNGVVIDPVIFKNEINGIKKLNIHTSELVIAKKAHLILPTHKILDAASEKMKGKQKIGSTLKGIGPTYMDKTGRNGLRVGDISSGNFKEKYKKLKNKHIQLLRFYNFEYDITEIENEWFKSIETLKMFKHIESEEYLRKAISNDKKILAEGAQGTLLDIDHGTYPYVTSSSTTAGGVSSGLGIGPKFIDKIIGISKAYATRVGEGPFLTELFDENGEMIAKKGNEFGATTGRPRRCGWLDLVALKKAIFTNSVTDLCITKLDVLDEMQEILVCIEYEKNKPVYKKFKGWLSSTEGITEYSDLPKEAKDYIEFIEDYIECSISIISTGPSRDQTINK